MSGSGLLLDLFVRSSLWMAMVGLAAVAVHRAGGSAAMRHRVWLLGLLGLLILPLLAVLLRPLPLPILAEPAAHAPVAAAAAVTVPSAIVAVPSAVAPIDYIAIFYCGVGFALLARLLVGRLLLVHLWRRSRPGDPGWGDLVVPLARMLGVRRRVALRIADRETMPMTWGSLRPRILLPATAPGWTKERRRIVLLHELAHVARCDSLGRAAATLVCALFWFQPAAWLAARRLDLEQEHACDDLVLARGAAPNAYARVLLDTAAAFRASPGLLPLPAAMAGTALERRLVAIVVPRSRRSAGAGFTLAIAAVAMITVALAATVTPVAAGRAAPAAPGPTAPILPVDAPAVATARPSVPTVAPAAPSPLRTASPVDAAVTTQLAAAAQVAVEAPPEPPAGDDYDRALARYRAELQSYKLELSDYGRDQARYNRELARYNREVARYNQALAAFNHRRGGNSGNSGNSGNTGNPGNPGVAAHDGRDAVYPTAPTAPTAPTMPTMPTMPTEPTQPTEPTRPTRPAPP